MSLVKLQQLEGQLSKEESGEEKMEMYEKLLMECQDAMQIVRDDIAAEKVSIFLHVLILLYCFPGLLLLCFYGSPVGSS